MQPLDRIAVDEPALPAPHETQRRVLGERDPIHQMLGRGVGSQPSLMVLPQPLDFRAQIVLLGDDLCVCVGADSASARFVRESRHEQLCR